MESFPKIINLSWVFAPEMSYKTMGMLTKIVCYFAHKFQIAVIMSTQKEKNQIVI
jgi:hypothetical protein